MKPNRLSSLLLFLLLLAACSPSAAALPTIASSSEETTIESPAKGVLPTLATSATSPATQTSAPAEVLLDDFEASASAWKPGIEPGYKDSSAVKVALSTEYPALGKQSLALTFQKNDKPKAIFFVEGQFDLARGATLALALSDPLGVIEAAEIAICTGEQWYWHQSAPVAVQRGPNELAFDLTASAYATEASAWQPKVPIASLSDVKRIVVLLYPKNNGTVYLDHLRLLSPGAPAAFSPTVVPQLTFAPTSTPAPCPGQALLPDASQPLALVLASPLPVGRYDLLEFAIHSSRPAQNPYDPAEIDLLLNVTAPDGAQFSVPAFWTQPFDAATASPCGQAGWRARLTPTQPGAWTVQAEIAGQNLLSQPLTVAVADSEGRGFVRLNSANNRYFAFDNGETFFPVGLNIGWWQAAPLEDYARWMDQLQANGGTLIRVWMASWSFAIEWNDTPLGNYDHRQYQAWLLDQLFEMAHQRGIYIELVLLNHGAFSDTVNPEWQNNPYNVALGGPLDSPSKFATDETARQLFKRRLRYIAARWGYSPQLFAWEWWNEVNWTPIAKDDLQAWVVEMTQVMRQYDPYRHLISISYASNPASAVLSLPEIDFLQHHEYSNLDPMTEFPGLFQWDRQIGGQKPVLFAEFGYSAAIENAESFDQTGLHLHNGLWAATFSGYASPAMYWWWDTYIDRSTCGRSSTD